MTNRVVVYSPSKGFFIGAIFSVSMWRRQPTLRDKYALSYKDPKAFLYARPAMKGIPVDIVFVEVPDTGNICHLDVCNKHLKEWMHASANSDS